MTIASGFGNVHYCWKCTYNQLCTGHSRLNLQVKTYFHNDDDNGAYLMGPTITMMENIFYQK